MKCDREQLTIAPDGKPMDQQPAWRCDFPVDVPQDNYVARRDFTKFMVLTSLAFTVGQFWIGAQNIWRKRSGKPALKHIATLSEVPVGKAITFDYPHEHDTCILVRISETDVVAYSQKCTHLQCAVTPDAENNCLHCPCHNGNFELSTGRVLGGPPRRPLPKVTLTIKGDEIYAAGMEVRTV